MALTTVNTDGIKDGTIKDIDVKSDAAIDGSKINPDFGSQNIVTTGSISGAAGTLTGDLTIPDTIVHTGDTNTKIRFPTADTISFETAGEEIFRINSDGKLLVGTTGALDSLNSSVQNNVSVSGSFICLGRNDTTVADTNGIGGIRFFSNDTSINSGNYLRVGEITCAADGDFLSGDAPTKMTFSTMTDGTTTLETRMTIDSSGNCGIGTSSPTDLLNLEFSSDNSTVAEGLFLNNTAGNTGDNVSLAFSTDSGNRKKSAISHVDEGPYGRGSLTFSIDGADTGSLDIVADEKFRINYDGNIGIGTTSPDSKLDIEGSGSPELRVTDTTNTVGAYIQSNNTKAIFGSRTNHPIQIEQNAGAALYIDTSKNVGIGTTSPSNKLHVISSDYQTARFESSAADANGAYIELYANSSSPADDDISGLISFKGNDSGGNETTYAQIRSYLDDVTDGTEDGILTFHTRDNGSFGERLRITSGGKLLLGTDTETNNIRLGNKFGIVGTAAYTGMSISQYAGTTAGHKPMIDFNRSRGSADGTMTSVAADDGLGEIIFRGSDGSNFEDGAAIRALVDGTPANDATDMPSRLTFHTSADGDTSLHERLRIASDGHVRIQKTGANAKLLLSRNEDVGTDDTATAVIDFANNTTHTVNSRIMAKTAGTGNVGGQLVIETRDPSSHSLEERLLIKSDKVMFSVDAKVDTDGEHDLGASGARWKDLYLSGGIQFDSRNNKLDDYEEGSWTPVFQYLDTTWQNCTFTDNLDYTNGRYTKIGNMVHGWYYTGYHTMASAANNKAARINGLPFPLKNGEPYYGGIFVFTHCDMFSDGTNPIETNTGYCNYSQSYIIPMRSSGSNNVNGASWSTSGHYIMVNFTYETD